MQPSGGEVNPAESAHPGTCDVTCRWETSDRAYSARVQRDLLGDLVLVCTNAGVGKRHYKERVVAVGREEVERALEQLAKRRRVRGYAMLTPPGRKLP